MKVKMVSKYEQVFKMLYTDRIDIVIEERFSGLKVINELGYSGELKIIKPPIQSTPAYHYVHVKHKALVPQLEKVL